MSLGKRTCEHDGPQLRIFAPLEADGDAEPGSLAGRTSGPLTADLKLSEFFALAFVPLFLRPRNAAAATLVEYQRSIDCWVAITGDPPLKAIDDWHAGRFVEGLYKLPGKLKGTAIAPATVRKHCTQVQTVLDRAGPRSKGNRLGQGLIEETPFIPKPRVAKAPPLDVYTLSEIGRMVDAAGKATAPRLDAVSARSWWRALFLTAYNTGLRIGTLRKIEYGHVDGEWLNVPGEIYKGNAPKRFWLTEQAREAIAGIRTARESIFPWPHCGRWLFANLKRIQEAAGMPAARCFGFHGFRKALGTELAAINPLAAQMALGHTNMKTTQEHYINPSVMVEAMRKMPQPTIRPDDSPRQLRLF